MKRLLQKAAKRNERISQKILKYVMQIIFRHCGCVRFPGIWHHVRATLRISSTFFLCCLIQISLFKHFPTAYFDLKNQILA